MLTLKQRLQEILDSVEDLPLEVYSISIDSDDNGYGAVEYDIHVSLGRVGDLTDDSPLPIDHAV